MFPPFVGFWGFGEYAGIRVWSVGQVRGSKARSPGVLGCLGLVGLGVLDFLG